MNENQLLTALKGLSKRELKDIISDINQTLELDMENTTAGDEAIMKTEKIETLFQTIKQLN